MPRRAAILIHDNTGAIARERPDALAHDTDDAGDVASPLPWLFPWVLALTGILITLVLMR
jgi:hypothetical protein